MLSQITQNLLWMALALHAPLDSYPPTKETVVIEHRYVYQDDGDGGYDRVRADQQLIHYPNLLLDLDAVYDVDDAQVVYPTSLAINGQDYRVIQVYDNLEASRILRVVLVEAYDARRFSYDRLTPVIEVP